MRRNGDDELAASGPIANPLLDSAPVASAPQAVQSRLPSPPQVLCGVGGTSSPRRQFSYLDATN